MREREGNLEGLERERQNLEKVSSVKAVSKISKHRHGCVAASMRCLEVNKGSHLKNMCFAHD